MEKQAKKLKRFDIIEIDGVSYFVMSVKTTWETIVYAQDTSDPRILGEGERFRFSFAPTEMIKTI